MPRIATAHADPTKAFFVKMITRDIALEDCVFDLIDNSVDGAWRLLGSIPMSLEDELDLSRFEIRIAISPEEFSIQDNCGGITLEDATEYAFSFGRREDDEAEDFSIGVYGIGMKRAVFKLGRRTEITSTYADGDVLRSFKVPIFVDDWLAQATGSWDFDIESSENLPEAGVRIMVTELTEDTRSSFSSPAFVSRLRRIIARDYALHLARGLRIFVNGQSVLGWKIELREGKAFKAMRREYEDEAPAGTVRVEILAGMAFPPPDSSEPESEDRPEDPYGWYVVCNGRIVVAADKSGLTGWGTEGWPKWHPQYYGFIGIVMFTAEQAVLLPLTTTKRSVDATSGVYRRARSFMREVTKAWISYTNNRKQALEAAKALEADTEPVTLREVTKDQNVDLPKLTPVPTEPTTTISYPMERRRIRALAEALDHVNLSAREVGRQSFELAFEELVGED